MRLVKCKLTMYYTDEKLISNTMILQKEKVSGRGLGL